MTSISLLDPSLVSIYEQKNGPIESVPPRHFTAPRSLQESRQQAFERGILDALGRIHESFKECDLDKIMLDEGFFRENIRQRFTTPIHGNTTLAQYLIYQRDNAPHRNNRVLNVKYTGSNAIKDVGIANIKLILGDFISEIISPELVENYLKPGNDTDAKTEFKECDHEQLEKESISSAVFFEALPSDTKKATQKELETAFKTKEIGYSENWDGKYSNTLRFANYDISSGGFVDEGHFISSTFYFDIAPESIDEKCENLIIKLVCPHNNFREVFLHFLLGIMACDKPESKNYRVSITYLSGLIRKKIAYDERLFPILLESTLRQFCNFTVKKINVEKLTTTFQNIIFAHHQGSLVDLLVAARLFQKLTFHISGPWKQYLTDEFYRQFWKHLISEDKKETLNTRPVSLDPVHSNLYLEALIQVHPEPTTPLLKELLDEVIQASLSALQKDGIKTAKGLWDCFFSVHNFASWNPSLEILLETKNIEKIVNGGLLHVKDFNPFQILLEHLSKPTDDIKLFRLKYILTYPHEFYDYDWIKLCKDEFTWNTIIKVTRISSLRQDYLVDYLKLTIAKKNYPITFKITELLCYEELNAPQKKVFLEQAYLLCGQVIAQLEAENTSLVLPFANLIGIFSRQPQFLQVRFANLISPFVISCIESINPSIPSSNHLTTLYPFLSQGLLFCSKALPSSSSKDIQTSKGRYNKLFLFCLKTLPPSYSQAIELFEVLSNHTLFTENPLSWQLSKDKVPEVLSLALEKGCFTTSLALLKNALKLDVPLPTNLVSIRIFRKCNQGQLFEILSHSSALAVLGTKLWHTLALRWFASADLKGIEALRKITYSLLKLYVNDPERISSIKNPEIIVRICHGIASLQAKPPLPTVNVSLGLFVHFSLHLSSSYTTHHQAMRQLLNYIAQQPPSQCSSTSFADIKALILRSQKIQDADFSILLSQFIHQDYAQWISGMDVESISLILRVIRTFAEQKKSQKASQWTSCLLSRAKQIDYHFSKNDIYVAFAVVRQLLIAQEFSPAQALLEHLDTFVQGKQKTTFEGLFSSLAKLSLLQNQIAPFVAFIKTADNLAGNHPELLLEGIRRTLPHNFALAFSWMSTFSSRLTANDWKLFWENFDPNASEYAIDQAFQLWMKHFPVLPPPHEVERYEWVPIAEMCNALIQGKRSKYPKISAYFISELEVLKESVAYFNTKDKPPFLLVTYYIKLRGESYFQNAEGTLSDIFKWLFDLKIDTSCLLTSINILLNLSLKYSKKECVCISIRNLLEKYKTADTESKMVYQRYFLKKFPQMSINYNLATYDIYFLSLFKTFYASEKFPLELSQIPFIWLMKTAESQKEESLKIQYYLVAFNIFYKVNKSSDDTAFFTECKPQILRLLKEISLIPSLFKELTSSVEIAIDHNHLEDSEYPEIYATSLISYLESVSKLDNKEDSSKKRIEAFECFLKKHLMYCNIDEYGEKAVSTAIVILLTMLDNSESITSFIPNCERLLKMTYEPLNYRNIEMALFRNLASKIKSSAITPESFPQFDDSKPSFEYYFSARIELIAGLSLLTARAHTDILKQKIIYCSLFGLLRGLCILIRLDIFQPDIETAYEALKTFAQGFNTFFYYDKSKIPEFAQDHQRLCCDLLFLLKGTKFADIFTLEMHSYALLTNCFEVMFHDTTPSDKWDAIKSIFKNTTTSYKHSFDKFMDIFLKEYHITQKPHERLLNDLKYVNGLVNLFEGINLSTAFAKFHFFFLLKDNVILGNDFPMIYRRQLCEIYQKFVHHYAGFIIVHASLGTNFPDHCQRLNQLLLALCNSNLFNADLPEDQKEFFDLFCSSSLVYFRNLTLLFPATFANAHVLYNILKRVLSDDFSKVPASSREWIIAQFLWLLYKQKREEDFKRVLKTIFDPQSNFPINPSAITPYFKGDSVKVIAASYSEALGSINSICKITDFLIEKLKSLLNKADGEIEKEQQNLFSCAHFYCILLESNPHKDTNPEIQSFHLKIVNLFIDLSFYDLAAKLLLTLFSAQILYVDDPASKELCLDVCNKGLDNLPHTSEVIQLFEYCCREMIITLNHSPEIIQKRLNVSHLPSKSELKTLLKAFLLEKWFVNALDETCWVFNFMQEFNSVDQKEIFQEGIKVGFDHKNTLFLEKLLKTCASIDPSLFGLFLPKFLESLMKTQDLLENNTLIKGFLEDLANNPLYINPALKSFIFFPKTISDLEFLFHSLPAEQRPPILGWLQNSKIQAEIVEILKGSDKLNIAITLQRLKAILLLYPPQKVQEPAKFYTCANNLLNICLSKSTDERVWFFFTHWFLENGSSFLFIYLSESLQQIVINNFITLLLTSPSKETTTQIQQILTLTSNTDTKAALSISKTILLIIQTMLKNKRFVEAALWMDLFLENDTHSNSNFDPNNKDLSKWIDALTQHHLFTSARAILEKILLKAEKKEVSCIPLISLLWDRVYHHGPINISLQIASAFSLSFIPPMNQLTGQCHKLVIHSKEDFFLLHDIIIKFRLTDDVVWRKVCNEVESTSEEQIIRKAFELLTFIDSSSEEFRKNNLLRSVCWLSIFGKASRSALTFNCALFREPLILQSLLDSFEESPHAHIFSVQLYKYLLQESRFLVPFEILFRIRQTIRFFEGIQNDDIVFLELFLDKKLYGIFNPFITILTTHLCSKVINPNLIYDLKRLFRNYQTELSKTKNVSLETITLLNSYCNNIKNLHPKATFGFEIALLISKLGRPEFIRMAFLLFKNTFENFEFNSNEKSISLFSKILLKIIEKATSYNDEIDAFTKLPKVIEIIPKNKYGFIVIARERSGLLNALKENVDLLTFKDKFKSALANIIEHCDEESTFQGIEMLIDCIAYFYMITLDKASTELLLVSIENNFKNKIKHTAKVTRKLDEYSGVTIFSVKSSHLKVRSHFINSLMSLLGTYPKKRKQALAFAYESTADFVQKYPQDRPFTAYRVIELLTCTAPQNKEDFDSHILAFNIHLKTKLFKNFWDTQKLPTYLWYVYTGNNPPATLIIDKNSKLLWIGNILDSLSLTPTWWNIHHFRTFLTSLSNTTQNITSEEYCNIYLRYFSAVSSLAIRSEEHLEFLEQIFEYALRHLQDNIISIQVLKNICYIMVKTSHTAVTSPELLLKTDILITNLLHNPKLFHFWKMNLNFYFKFIQDVTPALTLIVQQALPDKVISDLIHKFTEALTGLQFIENVANKIDAKRAEVLKFFIDTLSKMGYKGQNHSLQLSKNPKFKNLLST